MRQHPAAIVEQARAVRDEPVGSFSIYQLKGGNETLDYRFEPLDSIHRNGLSVKPENYELVYEAPLTEKDNLESIYTRFNVDRPADFTGPCGRRNKMGFLEADKICDRRDH